MDATLHSPHTDQKNPGTPEPACLIALPLDDLSAGPLHAHEFRHQEPTLPSGVLRFQAYTLPARK